MQVTHSKMSNSSTQLPHDFSFKVSRSYVNESRHQITVQPRNNLPVDVAAATSTTGRDLLIIRDVYTFYGKESIKATLDNIRQYSETYNLSDELDIIHKALTKNLREYSPSVTVTTDRSVDIALLPGVDTYYIDDLDLHLHYGKFFDDRAHPHSKEGRSASSISETLQTDTGSGVLIEIVDNENSISDRYLYAFKEIHELKPVRDRSRPSAVYLTKVSPKFTRGSRVVVEAIPLEEAEDRIGLHRSREAAVAGGDGEVLSRTQHLNAETELRRSKIALEQTKVQTTAEESQRARELAEMKHQLSKIELEQKTRIADLDHQLEQTKKVNAELKESLDIRKNSRADYYDERSTNRKDSSDLIKYVPAAILGLAAGFAYMGKK